jgi:ubiquinone/menaquinone biosynthesis C-methylase UbiE
MKKSVYNQQGDSVHRGFYDGRKIKWSDWGSPFYGEIQNLKYKSICDVGCGNGLFVNNLSKKEFVENIYGVDLVTVNMGLTIENSKVNYIDAPASDIPIDDKSVELLTAFDVLEHIHPSEVDNSLDEFFRITTKSFMFSIAHGLSGEEHGGENLHMTVKPFEWWSDKISKYAKLVKNFNPDNIRDERPFNPTGRGGRTNSIWKLKND